MTNSTQPPTKFEFHDFNLIIDQIDEIKPDEMKKEDDPLEERVLVGKLKILNEHQVFRYSKIDLLYWFQF